MIRQVYEEYQLPFVMKLTDFARNLSDFLYVASCQKLQLSTEPKLISLHVPAFNQCLDTCKSNLRSPSC